MYLYGTCGALSTRAVITRPSVSKLWLMLPASLARLSTAPDLPMFSLPARSTYGTNMKRYNHSYKWSHNNADVILRFYACNLNLQG